MADRRPIAVAYDQGAVSPAEIAVGLAPLGPVVFLLPRSDHVDRLEPVLARLGEVVLLGGKDDVARLRALRPKAVLTFSENLMRETAALAEGLGLPGHTEETAVLLTDKYRQRERLRAAGVDPVRSGFVPEPGDGHGVLREVGLPAVVKPAQGQGSGSTFLVTDEEAGTKLIEELRDVSGGLVVEEFLTGRPSLPHGDYVSVETASRDGDVLPIAVTGKHPLWPPFREVGQFWPAVLEGNEGAEVIALAVAAVRALGVRTGICHTEIKLTVDGPRIIEVNGRLGGHLNELARRSCGVDLVRTAGLLATGQPPPHGYLRPDTVHFQFNAQAPTVACTLHAVDGVDRVRDVPGIAGYRPYVRPGAALPGGVKTTSLDLLTGSAPDHAAMVGILDEALSRISYTFEADGTFWSSTPTLSGVGWS